MLERDGVHLKPAAGDSYLKHLLQSVQSSMPTSVPSSSDVLLLDEFTNVASESDDDIESVEDEDRLGAILKIVRNNSKKLSAVRPLRDTLARLDARTDALETQVRLRRQRDNLVFARIKEESDYELNKSREDRVLISGLPRSTPAVSSHQDKKDHYTKVITDLILKACPETDPKPTITDVIISIHRNQVSPSVEAKFDSVAGALSFRKAASTLAKAQDPDFSSLYFSNSVTQATRVRIEIMKAIAKKLTTETESAFVQSFIPRPALRYVSSESTAATASASGTGRSYSFVDSVTRFGDLLQDHELASAYKRAGGTFRGAMEQYFVVLRETEDAPLFSAVNRAPLGLRGGRRGRGSPPVRGGTRGVRGVRGMKRPGSSPSATPTKRKPTST
jgi:hypothetical protein